MRPLTIDQLVTRYMRPAGSGSNTTNRMLEFSAWLGSDPKQVQILTTKQVRLLFSGDGFDTKTSTALKNFLFSEQYVQYSRTHSVRLQAMLKSRESWRAIEVSVCSRTGVLFVPKLSDPSLFDYLFDKIGSKSRSESQKSTASSPPTYIHKSVTRTTNRSKPKTKSGTKTTKRSKTTPAVDQALSNLISEAMIEGITDQV